MKTFVVLCCFLAAAVASDDCVDTFMPLPVCGSDGKTYSNPWMLDCEREKHNKDLKFVKYGQCQNIDTAIRPDDDFCICSGDFDPVCGSDGKTYNNPCEFECAKKNHKSLRKIGHMECENIIAAIKPVDDFCVCTFEYAPVCGSDGRTYSNLCEFKCIKKHQPSLRLVGHYKCEDVNTAIKPDDDFCVCTFEYAPVCGSDGRTYSNLCEFKCNKKHQPSLRLVGRDACEKINAAMQPSYPCICTREWMPVCGSDGVTYGNHCEMKCAQSKNPGLEIVGMDACENLKKVKQDPCVCTREWMPVCGSDGVTYGNHCEMKCAQSKNPGLEIVGMDACANLKKVKQDPCVCTREWMPVCGSDGVTYGNHCEMKCAQSKNPGLEIVGMDECENLKKVKHDDPCICTREYMPVCGSDGRTYSNKCVFRCSQSKKPELKLAHRGKCEKKEFETCGCGKEYKPVCGNDLKTYGNMCLFNCAASKKQGLKLMYKMVCMIV